MLVIKHVSSQSRSVIYIKSQDVDQNKPGDTRSICRRIECTKSHFHFLKNQMIAHTRKISVLADTNEQDLQNKADYSANMSENNEWA